MSTYIDSQWYPSVSRRFSLSGSPAAPSVIQHLGGQTCAVVLSFKMLQGFPRYSEHFRANDFPLHGQPRLTDSMSSLFHSFGMLSRPALQQCNMQTSQCTTWERCSSPIPLPAAVRLFVNLHYSCLWWNQTRAVAWMCPYVALECIGTHSKSFNISRTVHECHCMSAVFSLFVAPALRVFLQDTPSPSGYCEVASQCVALQAASKYRRVLMRNNRRTNAHTHNKNIQKKQTMTNKQWQTDKPTNKQKNKKRTTKQASKQASKQTSKQDQTSKKTHT